jgi:hypothetical protein
MLLTNAVVAQRVAGRWCNRIRELRGGLVSKERQFSEGLEEGVRDFG